MNKIDSSSSQGAEVQIEDELVFATVEIKTSIAKQILDLANIYANTDVIFCIVGDETFHNVIPQSHMGQVLQQFVVLSVRYVVYVSASEAGILYVTVVFSSEGILQICHSVLRKAVEPSASWAHNDDSSFWKFADAFILPIMKKKLPFWRLCDRYVKEKGLFHR